MLIIIKLHVKHKLPIISWVSSCSLQLAYNFHKNSQLYLFQTWLWGASIVKLWFPINVNIKDVATEEVSTSWKRACTCICTTGWIWVEAKKQRYGVILKVQLSRKLQSFSLATFLEYYVLACYFTKSTEYNWSKRF